MQYTQQNKNSIKSLFNQIASYYDLMNNYMSFGLQKHIKYCAVKNAIKHYNGHPVKILDLCTGTGDIAIMLKKILPNAEIYAVDFSENMLNIAKQHSDNITFIQKDITNLGNEKPFAEGTFDLCFISFGLRNLPDIDDFLLNIKKYLKNEGVLSILDLGKPLWLFSPYFFIHYKIIIPLISLLLKKNNEAYKYLTESAKNYPTQKIIINKLKKFGYKNLKIKNFVFGIISQQMGQI